MEADLFRNICMAVRRVGIAEMIGTCLQNLKQANLPLLQAG